MGTIFSPKTSINSNFGIPIAYLIKKFASKNFESTPIIVVALPIKLGTLPSLWPHVSAKKIV